jgi:hypothetical protein
MNPVFILFLLIPVRYVEWTMNPVFILFLLIPVDNGANVRYVVWTMNPVFILFLLIPVDNGANVFEIWGVLSQNLQYLAWPSNRIAV